jgi:hypothetical protein
MLADVHGQLREVGIARRDDGVIEHVAVERDTASMVRAKSAAFCLLALGGVCTSSM